MAHTPRVAVAGVQGSGFRVYALLLRMKREEKHHLPDSVQKGKDSQTSSSLLSYIVTGRLLRVDCCEYSVENQFVSTRTFGCAPLVTQEPSSSSSWLDEGLWRGMRIGSTTSKMECVLGMITGNFLVGHPANLENSNLNHLLRGFTLASMSMICNFLLCHLWMNDNKCRRAQRAVTVYSTIQVKYSKARTTQS